MPLKNLAAWINRHDDGTPQPRATVQGNAVLIRSTEVLADGTLAIAEISVTNLASARAVLGY
jgi:hypothetical protein